VHRSSFIEELKAVPRAYQRVIAQPNLVAFAIEPSGDQSYCEAVREWIERVSPAPSSRGGALRLVR